MLRFVCSSALTLVTLLLQPACTLSYSATATAGETDATGGTPPCPDPNSQLVGTECLCDVSYQRCNPDDPEDLSCCLVNATDGGVTSEPVTTTASDTTTTTASGTTTGPGTTDEPGTSTTTGGTTEADTTTGDGTTGGPVCEGAQQPPPDCNDGSYFCTQPEACGPEDSELYRCVAGAWVLDESLAEDNCLFDGFDFTYGCVDDANSNKLDFVCGDGPGTACSNDQPSTCVDDKVIAECVYGKLSHFDCYTLCTEVGDDMGVLYDHGSCGEDQGQTACLCCDMGDPGCPI